MINQIVSNDRRKVIKCQTVDLKSVGNFSEYVKISSKLRQFRKSKIRDFSRIIKNKNKIINFTEFFTERTRNSQKIYTCSRILTKDLSANEKLGCRVICWHYFLD